MRTSLFRCALVLLVLQAGAPAFGDNLEPPGPPGSEAARMKTLNQVEPRYAIETLPFIISNSGPYYLTGSLTGVAASNGVTVNASGVTLDLNGFALKGATGSLAGVYIQSTAQHVTIFNGSIADWGGDGISANNVWNGHISGLRIHDNGGYGARLYANWFVNNCCVYGNSGVGLLTAGSGIVRDSQFTGNKAGGVYTSGDTLLYSCTANQNTNYGIKSVGYLVIRDCLSRDNSVDGIVVGRNARVVNNMCQGHYYGAGINVLQAKNHIEGNTLMNNARAVVVTGATATGNCIIRNVSINATNPPAYDIRTGNYYGDVLGINDIGSSFTNSNPWANIDI